MVSYINGVIEKAKEINKFEKEFIQAVEEVLVITCTGIWRRS